MALVKLEEELLPLDHLRPIEEDEEERRLTLERLLILMLSRLLVDMLREEDSINTEGLSWTISVSIDETLLSWSSWSMNMSSELRLTSSAAIVGKL